MDNIEKDVQSARIELEASQDNALHARELASFRSTYSLLIRAMTARLNQDSAAFVVELDRLSMGIVLVATLPGFANHVRELV